MGDTPGEVGPAARPPRGLRLEQLLTVTDETDEHGRLLLEDSAPEPAQRRAVKAGVAMDTVACAYPDAGSRRGGLMNRSAYEEVRRETGAVLDGFAWLLTSYAAASGRPRGTVQALTDVAKLGNLLPLVLLHRAQDPVAPHGAMPSFVASLFKASRGVYSAAFARLVQAEEDAGADGGAALITAADFVAYAEAEGHLRRPQTGRVCAAPTRLIERTIQVILTGEGANPDGNALGGLVDFGMLWRFFQLDESFSDGLNRFRFVLERLMRSSGIPDPKLLRRELRDLPGPDGQTFDEFVDGFLEFANDVQSSMNEALGRRGAAPKMLYGDVLRAL